MSLPVPPMLAMAHSICGPLLERPTASEASAKASAVSSSISNVNVLVPSVCFTAQALHALESAELCPTMPVSGGLIGPQQATERLTQL